MRNVLPLIVIIFAVVALIIVVGFIIGTVTHNIKNESAEEETQEQPVVQKEVEEPLLPVSEELFSLQIMASSKYDNVIHLQDKLKQAQFETEISTLMRDGTIIYRLRLTGLYNEEDAINLGEDLKQRYPAIEGCWLEEQQTRTAEASGADAVPKAKPEYEKEIKITKKKIEFGKECEVQLLASSNYALIEKIKNALEKDGYKSKIHTLTKGKNIIYRLRLRGLYSEAEGRRLGNEIVKKSPQVTSFWLDEIKDGQSVGQMGATVTQKKTAVKQIPASTGDYEIQILANTKRSYVEDKKRTLESAGYKAKIVTTSKNGKTFYRLRLANSYSRSKATQIGNKLKKDVRFVTDFWIVSKAGVTPKASTTKKKPTTVKKQPVKDKSLTEPIQYSMNPKYNKKNKKPQKTMTCTTNDINIRIGPGTYYAVDPIGKLMKGVTVFVIDEKNDWVKFTITPDDKSWAGWVNKKYLK